VGQQGVAYWVKLGGEDSSRCSNKTESVAVGLRKCPYYHYLTKTAMSQKKPNISQGLPQVMVGKLLV